MEKEVNRKSQTSGNLYKNRDPRNFIFGQEPRAFYWYKYRLTHYLIQEELKRGEKIDIPSQVAMCSVPSELPLSDFELFPESSCYDIPIVIVGNNRINPFAFDIRNRDRCNIEGFNLPGKSATIAFSYNLAETCGGIFDRDCRRQDHLYISSVTQIQECNYSVYYVPTENQPLHVRLVHNVHESNPREHLPPFKDRKELAEVFSMGRVV